MKYNANYRGIVKAHGSHGKCKIFVPGVYAESTITSDLPDAEPAQSLFAGCNSGQGVFQYPLVGSTVWVFFENGDHNRPIFFATSLGGTEASQNFTADKYIIKTKTSTIIIDDTTGNIDITTDTSHNITVPTINITSTSKVDITSPNVNVNQGTVTVTGGDVIADGITLKTHYHLGDGAASPPANTSAPIG